MAKKDDKPTGKDDKDDPKKPEGKAKPAKPQPFRANFTLTTEKALADAQLTRLQSQLTATFKEAGSATVSRADENVADIAVKYTGANSNTMTADFLKRVIETAIVEIVGGFTMVHKKS
jgi:hypothetical protein